MIEHDRAFGVMAPVNIQQRIGQKTANLAQPNGKTIKLETPHPIIQSNYIGMYTWHVRACGWLKHCIDFPCDHTGHETNLCCHQRSPAVPIGVAHGLNHRVRTATSTSFFKHLHTTGVDLSSTIQNVKKKVSYPNLSKSHQSDIPTKIEIDTTFMII